jgi:hypothetical protein
MIRNRIFPVGLGRLFPANSYNRNRGKKQERPVPRSRPIPFRINTLQIRAAK